MAFLSTNFAIPPLIKDGSNSPAELLVAMNFIVRDDNFYFSPARLLGSPMVLIVS